MTRFSAPTGDHAQTRKTADHRWSAGVPRSGTPQVLLGRLGRSLLRSRASTHEHARMAPLAGRPDPALGAMVLEVPKRAVYCVAGRPHAIVVTPGGPDALDVRYLDAVVEPVRKATVRFIRRPGCHLPPVSPSGRSALTRLPDACWMLGH